MNPHRPPSTTLNALIGSIWTNRQLILQMTKREVAGRFKGSVFGLTWVILNPLLMLTMYTFVFSEVFSGRWSAAGDENKGQFALILFVGMIVQGFFSEVLSRAPGLVLANVNYVKKIVFPLEILPVISLAAALFHLFVSLMVLLAISLFVNGYIYWTALYIPLVVLPFFVLTLGFAWILASLGVFLRDVGQSIGLLMTFLLFLSPVFYPLSSLPEKLRPFMMANPLTFIIEQARAVLMFGVNPNWTGLGVYSLVSILIAWLGFSWFQKTKKGFANVL